jgi:glycosyltransferase involved in cell wall biosynthesis
MRRLVFITQQVDPAHPALAATVPMVAAVARRVDEVVVLADRAIRDALPANCRVRSFRARSKPGRGIAFESALADELRRGKPAAVVAHMCPIYAVLAAPLCRPLRVPLLLWFTHWHAGRLLELAERCATAVVTVESRTFPLPSGKVHAIGHGIDLSEFPCRSAPPNRGEGLWLLAAGRYSPAKGLPVVLEAVHRLPGTQLRVVGPALTAEERRHRGELARQVAELGLEDAVALEREVPRERIPELFAAADALVNNMRAGATDKVVFEACASCVPAFASNPAFDTLLPDELRFSRDDPDELAGRLRAFSALDRPARAAIGSTLRERVAVSHSVETWADGILAAAGIG